MQKVHGDNMSLSKRSFLYFNYCLFIFWLILVCLSYLHPIFTIITGAIQWLLMVYFFVVAIFVFFSTKKWKSEERIVSIIFLVPIICFVVVPVIKEQIRLYNTIPDDKLIKSYIQNQYSGNTEILDTSIQIASYDSSKRHLTLHFKVKPNVFIKDEERVHGEFQIDPERSAKIFMNVLNLNLIEQPEHITEVTKVPKQITVLGYWGDKFFLSAIYELNKNRYKLIQPFPNVSLVGLENKWFLQFEIEGKQERLFIKNVPNSIFNISLLRSKDINK
jgi:hypothetical protein